MIDGNMVLKVNGILIEAIFGLSKPFFFVGRVLYQKQEKMAENRMKTIFPQLSKIKF